MQKPMLLQHKRAHIGQHPTYVYMTGYDKLLILCNLAKITISGYFSEEKHTFIESNAILRASK